MSNGSTQARLDLTAIRGSVAHFGTGERTTYCAVMEVFGSQQSLAKLDPSKQEALRAGYAQFLNSLAFPFQLLVHVEPVDLAWYVTRVEERARALSPALVSIARDHAAFVQGLVRQRTLLEHSRLAARGGDGSARRRRQRNDHHAAARLVASLNVETLHPRIGRRTC